MISHRHRCIFSHVPKTAGKSVRALFDLPEFEQDFDRSDKNFEDAYGHRRLIELSSAHYFNSYFKFAFVRNPFDRLVSAFFYLDRGGCNDSDRRFRDERLARYQGSFHAFVEDLSANLDAAHFRPQTTWLCDDKLNLLTDFVGRYETLAGDVLTVSKILDLTSATLPVINASQHEPYRAYFDEGTRRRVARAYSDDLEVFSYV